MFRSDPHSLFTRRRLLASGIGGALAFAFGKTAKAEEKAVPAWELTIRDEFEAPVDNIRNLLLSAAEALWRHCSQAKFTAKGLTVYRHTKWPITHYKHENDQILIGLNTNKLFWSQYSFQFAHEFCHALAQHTRDEQRRWHGVKHRNHWLEECFCETASLFVLRAMAKTWQSKPPYPNWKNYSASLADYAQKRIDEGNKFIPQDQSFADWFAKELPSLQEQPTQRDKNLAIAVRLLPLFENDPMGWEAMTALNVTTKQIDIPLVDHLDEWHSNAAAAHRSFVMKVTQSILPGG
jgi:hypothetical protein